MNNRTLIGSILLAATVLLVGCDGTTSRLPPIEVWPDMRRQDKGKPQAVSKFYGDMRASRMPVPGTVARGYLKEDDAYTTGIVNNTYLGKNPEKIDADLMKLGQKKYTVYCTPCHSRVGDGKGIVAVKAAGTWIPSNLQEDRMKAMADGEIYSVITQGRRSMPAYRFQIVAHDRCAIVAYVRPLQPTTSGTLNDLPQELPSELR